MQKTRNVTNTWKPPCLVNTVITAKVPAGAGSASLGELLRCQFSRRITVALLGKSELERQLGKKH